MSLIMLEFLVLHWWEASVRLWLRASFPFLWPPIRWSRVWRDISDDQALCKGNPHLDGPSALVLPLVHIMGTFIDPCLVLYSQGSVGGSWETSEAPALSYIWPGGQAKSRVIQSPVMGSWEIQAHRCYSKSPHVLIQAWTPQTWSSGAHTAIYG